jgi:hypothetical protein
VSDGWEEDESVAEVAEGACTSFVEPADNSASSAPNTEDGPTGILPPARASCPIGASPSACWLASVELETLEAILTCDYYILGILRKGMTLNSTSAR